MRISGLRPTMRRLKKEHRMGSLPSDILASKKCPRTLLKIAVAVTNIMIAKAF